MGVWDVELCVSGSEFCLYGLGFGGWCLGFELGEWS